MRLILKMNYFVKEFLIRACGNYRVIGDEKEDPIRPLVRFEVLSNHRII